MGPSLLSVARTTPDPCFSVPGCKLSSRVEALGLRLSLLPLRALLGQGLSGEGWDRVVRVRLDIGTCQNAYYCECVCVGVEG